MSYLVNITALAQTLSAAKSWLRECVKSRNASAKHISGVVSRHHRFNLNPVIIDRSESINISLGVLAEARGKAGRLITERAAEARRCAA